MVKIPFMRKLITLMFVFEAVIQVYGQNNYVARKYPVTQITDLSTGEKAGRKIDLATEAKLTASHHTTEWVIGNAIDGDPKTQWVGEGHPLTWQPTNIIIEFKKPKTVQRVVLVSAKNRNLLAIKDFEIFAWGKNGWAGQTPLVTIKDTKEEINTVDFDPVKTKSLRIRLRDTYYYHIFPRLVEIEVYEALPGAKGNKLADAPIPDENKTERLILDRAFGKVLIFPRSTFDPSLGYLKYATTFADTMIASGTDRYGKVNSPMFASLIDMDTHRNPLETPEDSPGQRFGDRSIHGGNLFQDVMLLQALDNMSKLTGNQKYQQAVTDYLTFFLKNCPHPNTGLFPWGEHAYWNFYEEQHNSDTHEFLGGIPNSFWERMWKINPRAVLGESNGLVNHIQDFETFHFDRHADIVNPMPVPRPAKYGGMDFNRHAGFYIHLWTFAYSKTLDPKYMAYSENMINHHWNNRSSKSGLPPNLKNAKDASSASSLALSLSLLEAAELLPQGDEMRKRYEMIAKTYLDAILRLPHKPTDGQFLMNIQMDQTPEAATGNYGETYAYGYGGGLSADYAGLLLEVYQITKDVRALKLAEGFAEYYAGHDPPPITKAVYARVYASIIGLFNNLYEISGKDQYLSQSKRYAKYAIENLFYNGLFRGTTDIGHYEASMMVGDLVYNLVWLDAIGSKTNIKIEPNYFAK